VGGSGDFTGNYCKTRCNQRFTSYAAFGVLLHHFIEHRIGNLVGDFVRVAFGHRFRSKKKVLKSLAQNDTLLWG